MLRGTSLTSLTAIFGSSGDKPEENESESEKLLNLYWNRAELKKEFAELRSEKFRLQDRIKEHEGATARVQQQFDHLENLLLDPEWVHNVVTYFQLRGLNLRCQARLAKFSEQLKQQREQRQQSQIVDDWNELRCEEAAGIEQQVGDTVMCMAYSLGAVSGGAFNPAVAVGISFAEMAAWSDIWIFLLGNLTAGLAAATVFGFVYGKGD